MSRAAVIALVACVVSAALEGLFAGRNVKDYMARLRMPSYSPPMWLWYIIGALYYVACFVVIYRVVGEAPASALRTAALILVGALMSMNALWNYVFFRARNLFAATLASFPYNLVAIALLLCLVRLDLTAALVFAPYLAYLLFANFWGYQLWRLNR